ncbi:MAG: bifunctional phosphoribosylaminoimidazolecarboxamide formyltransferase/inosine monophosphate cyclohydrolase [Candidatus Buchananbacteria bacterium CG10_big_fil_rev_8_21_14_0_10_42_9]|uniref:Bifunctional purine biosynthesis protein PurH n=1 Tax=Candidatus Buchananbacteria bacterium CG10_big_fil_rev_8_21_14_0_10_42_9 TaxID=1974526 RepID=A0A2H0W3H2_9BACT|nr:MAG: bifunctional phosphoribosylaminoimidazolecarboxamide formyltransferase/inosine monophosphate cyclohydrolase [Candidatus Buchananbacteria bacterium CG10_big_fil_rev_8_21_14_0_10_42_9]
MPKVLISVFDKTGIEDFAKGLVALGWEVISTGGTLKALQEAGVNAVSISEVTNFPEIMDGRVKTLHPNVHAGLLADRDVSEHMQTLKEQKIEPIDMVVVNLYPFQEVVSKPEVLEEDAIENIDIGGPTMLRSAAKNHKHVVVVTDPDDYDQILEQLKNGGVSQETKRILMTKVFQTTAEYDTAIAKYFGNSDDLTLNFKKLYNLRYGENPHQKAAFFKDPAVLETSIAKAEILHGKQLSYNNIVDADGALNLIKEFDEPAAAVIKHTNPAGCAIAKNINEAYRKAFQADSKSAFGGIAVMNRPCTKEIAEMINDVFMEVVLAPDFEPSALETLKQKKNIRLIKLGKIEKVKTLKDYRKVVGGILEQDIDRAQINKDTLKVVSQKQPNKKELKQAIFAWKVAKHVKSNAIVLVKGDVTVGVGAGQMSRVDAVEMAVKKAGAKVDGCVVASDAFFPFRDSIDELAKAGITCIIQPGGSIKDEEVIAAANERGMSMIFTGQRAFKH